ncbi:hypothetical protein [Arthrobacter caoxuetaonis]|uniref:Uncharacterized protein n=1 Tax=Arthrobacter caoxuetaonis TaxID=2886935 RepID=A0A9X1MH67_9MICC|nr:hypothetical protein [Arthrobacter caoxuetaonis]MCC3299751.1 hypothetical protein [Arthrobacter caoxuetaonis]USQ59347.1 hypothetical protein NF551_17345 [Arthrobacter caoxuetaonis]
MEPTAIQPKSARPAPELRERHVLVWFEDDRGVPQPVLTCMHGPVTDPFGCFKAYVEADSHILDDGYQGERDPDHLCTGVIESWPLDASPESELLWDVMDEEPEIDWKAVHTETLRAVNRGRGRKALLPHT